MSLIIAARMTEAELEENIRDYCLDLGILRFHVHDSRGMTRGFPDDVLIGHHGLLWRENKTMRGGPTTEQRTVGRALVALGQDWKLWRPSDLVSGRILRELREIA